jgi:hypothetical protein
MNDYFDGSVNLRRYDRAVFEPFPCELIAFESYGAYTLTRLRFDRNDVYLFVLKSKVVVEPTPNGVLAAFISSGAALAFSIGGSAYISDGRAVQDAHCAPGDSFAGFDASGILRLVPGGVLSAVDSGVIHGAEASPFLLVHGKRLVIEDGERRKRDRLLIAQLRTGEPSFIYVRDCDIVASAGIAFQLGCSCAAVAGNEWRIDICGKGIMQNRQSGCAAAFVVR